MQKKKKKNRCNLIKYSCICLDISLTLSCLISFVNHLLIYIFFYLFVVVSQQSGILSNLGTNISSPNSESDNHAHLDEKEDSYFSEIRNFISNSELNQACSSSEKRYELAHTHNTHMHRIYFEAMATNRITCQSQTRSVLKLQSVL